MTIFFVIASAAWRSPSCKTGRLFQSLKSLLRAQATAMTNYFLLVSRYNRHARLIYKKPMPILRPNTSNSSRTAPSNPPRRHPPGQPAASRPAHLPGRRPRFRQNHARAGHRPGLKVPPTPSPAPLCVIINDYRHPQRHAPLPYRRLPPSGSALDIAVLTCPACWNTARSC